MIRPYSKLIEEFLVRTRSKTIMGFQYQDVIRQIKISK